MRISDWSSDVCSSDLQADQRAIGHMERAIQTEDDWSSAWRELAIAYGRVGRIGDSSLALAEQFARAGQWRAAGGQAKRAQIGSASCGESVCQYVEIWVVDVASQKKKKKNKTKM